MEKTRKLVLVVEDEQSFTGALKNKLERSGYMVLCAKNGESGLQIALQEKPDVILLDIVMPKMDGITLMNTLRKDAWGKNVPIIILTNLSVDDDETVRSVVEGKPAYYLVKGDWKIQDIVEKLDAIMQKEEAEKEF